MSIGSHRSSHVWPRPRSHVGTRLVPQKPRKLSGGKFSHHPALGHMSHKRLENFQGPGMHFHRPGPGHMFEAAWSHKSPENFWGPGKFFHHPAPGHMFEPAWESFSTAPPPVTCSNPPGPGPTKANRTFGGPTEEFLNLD